MVQSESGERIDEATKPVTKICEKWHMIRQSAGALATLIYLPDGPRMGRP